MPHDFPPYQTVYHFFRLWRLDGTWEPPHTALREQLLVNLGCDSTRVSPSSTSSPAQGAPRRQKMGLRDYDGGKKVKGRKRHLLVDTEGLVLRVVVHAADVQDRDGDQRVLAGSAERYPRLRHLWVDAGYRGPVVGWIERTLARSVEVFHHWWTGSRGVWVLEGQVPPELPRDFQVLSRRWVVERTFA